MPRTGRSRADLRSAWDHRAREDPVYWSCVRADRSGSTDVEDVLAEGAKDAVALLGPALERIGLEPAGASLLDLGAGFGRMFRGYAALGFGDITGAEISLEMARLGARWADGKRCRFVVIGGTDLAALRSESFGFCISRGVLPYQVRLRDVWQLLAELHRVLVPGGGFLLHLGGRQPTLKRRLNPLLRLGRGAASSGSRILAIEPRRVVRFFERRGCTDVTVLEDPRRGRSRELRYYVAGRKEA